VDRLTSVAVDFTVGFGALFLLGIVYVIALVLHLNTFVPLGAALFFVVAAVRAFWSKVNPWLEGLLISLGASVPVGLFGFAISSHPARLGATVLGVTVVCGAGAQTTYFVRTRRNLFAAATVAALVPLVFFGSKHIPMPTLPSPGLSTMDTPAPAFTLTTLNNPAPLTLDSLKGRVVVLDFWGTWCEPCMAEMPSVLRVHREYQSNRDVVFLAVNPGWHDDTPDKIRTTVQQKHIDMPIVLDNTGATKTLNVSGLPTLIVIDRDGHIRMRDIGYSVTENLEDELSGQIDELLKPTSN
jgi:thiol-disulfide isomerase/thioredoxin